jgi:hypothetical protein
MRPPPFLISGYHTAGCFFARYFGGIRILDYGDSCPIRVTHKRARFLNPFLLYRAFRLTDDFQYLFNCYLKALEIHPPIIPPTIAPINQNFPSVATPTAIAPIKARTIGTMQPLLELPLLWGLYDEEGVEY